MITEYIWIKNKIEETEKEIKKLTKELNYLKKIKDEIQ